MATCLSTINNTTQLVELSSDITHRLYIDGDNNALFSLSNELDQSVFFTARFVGAYSSFSVSLTIYNKNTLRVFGTLNLNQQSVNTSFTIVAGEYYVCIRPISGSYTLDFSTKYISYNKVASFIAQSNFGWESTFDMELEKGEVSFCNRRLVYTIIDGKLPNGLEMQDNGLITGTLPMMDCDPDNNHLPPSASWYHQLSDSEYVTPWGRAYRFKVHLTLFDDRTKEDIRWFYIVVINDYSKNIALVDKYEMLEDDKIATFEEKIVLSNLSLCPVPEEKSKHSTIPTYRNAYADYLNDPRNYEVKKSFKFNNDDLCCNEDSDFIVLDPIITDFEEPEEISPENQLYLNVEAAQVDDPESDIIYEVGTGYDLDMDGFVEMFELDSEYVRNDEFYYKGKSLDEFIVENYNDDDNLLIVQFKDSYNMNRYLLESNFDEQYINRDALERFDYKNISVRVIFLDDIYYLELSSEQSEITTLNDAAERLEELQQENYGKLPITPYAWHGFTSEARII